MRTAKAVGMEMLFEPGHTGVAIKQSQNWKIHVHQYTKFALLVLLSQRQTARCLWSAIARGCARCGWRKSMPHSPRVSQEAGAVGHGFDLATASLFLS